MRYRPDRYSCQISQLGYGCIRFSRKGNAIDYEKAEKEADRDLSPLPYKIGFNAAHKIMIR